jgi:simple sugar transport system permease protein
VAGYLLAYLLRTVLRDPTSASPQSKPLPGPFLIPHLPMPGGLQAGVIVAVAVVIAAVWWNRSRSAFLVDVHGRRPVLAARMGLSPGRAVLWSMLVTGTIPTSIGTVSQGLLLLAAALAIAAGQRGRKRPAP